MTVCVDNGYGAGYCVTQLQKQRMLGTAHKYKKSFRVDKSVSLNGFIHHINRMVTRSFTYKGRGQYLVRHAWLTYLHYTWFLIHKLSFAIVQENT